MSCNIFRYNNFTSKPILIDLAYALSKRPAKFHCSSMIGFWDKCFFVELTDTKNVNLRKTTFCWLNLEVNNTGWVWIIILFVIKTLYFSQRTYEKWLMKDKSNQICNNLNFDIFEKIKEKMTFFCEVCGLKVKIIYLWPQYPEPVLRKILTSPCELLGCNGSFLMGFFYLSLVIFFCLTWGCSRSFLISVIYFCSIIFTVNVNVLPWLDWHRMPVD